MRVFLIPRTVCAGQSIDPMLRANVNNNVMNREEQNGPCEEGHDGWICNGKEEEENDRRCGV